MEAFKRMTYLEELCGALVTVSTPQSLGFSLRIVDRNEISNRVPGMDLTFLSFRKKELVSFF